MERFCKSNVLSTIAKMAKSTEHDPLWKEFPGVGPGRMIGLYYAREVANGPGPLNKTRFARAISCEMSDVLNRHGILVGGGCAQTRGRGVEFAEAYGHYSALSDLMEHYDL